MQRDQSAIPVREDDAPSSEPNTCTTFLSTRRESTTNARLPSPPRCRFRAEPSLLGPPTLLLLLPPPSARPPLAGRPALPSPDPALRQRLSPRHASCCTPNRPARGQSLS